MTGLAIRELDLAVDAGPDCRVWRLDLDLMPAGEAECASFADFELARLARLRRPQDVQRYRAAHWGLRLVLAQCLALVPQALRLREDQHGKPHLVQPGAPGFSLSHSHGLAVVAVSSTADIGVDVEQWRVLPDVDALARSHLSPSEWQAFSALDLRARSPAFLKAWTRKEAALKALGSGLLIEPADVEVGFGDQASIWTAPAPWGARQVEVLPDPGVDGMVLALARVLLPRPAAAPASCSALLHCT